MKFTKMHGAGNDYVYVNGFEEQLDWPALSRFVSNRHTGIGSDGLIVAQKSDSSHLKMSMFNADGSEGEMCGNGIRCLVAFAIDEGIVAANTEIQKVETKSGELLVRPIIDGDHMVGASVSMGRPILEPSRIPVDLPNEPYPILDYPLEIDGYRFSLSFVSMGNPHAVSFIDGNVDEFPLDKIGPLMENHPLFPNRVNFEINNVNSRNKITTRVWERGSGLTMACGTGACAVVVAAVLKGLVDRNVEVELPGGALEIDWRKDDAEVMMTGPVQTVFKGELDWPLA